MIKKEIFKTSKGFEFEKVDGGWKDLTSGIIWFEDIKTNINQYDAEAFAISQNKRLPTKVEFEEAEERGIRELPMSWNAWFWSSTVYPGYSDLAYVFNGYYGYVGYVNRSDSYYYGAARCVSSTASSSDNSELKINKAKALLKQALEVLEDA